MEKINKKNFDFFNLKNKNLQNKNLTGYSFKKTNLTNANFKNSIIKYSDRKCVRPKSNPCIQTSP